MPALGIYQMEPETYHLLWENYIKEKHSLMMKLSARLGIYQIPSEDRLIYDLRFATIMARIFYLSIQETVPHYKDVEQVWNYYKKYYNTVSGKAEKTSSLLKYQNFIHNSHRDNVLG